MDKWILDSRAHIIWLIRWIFLLMSTESYCVWLGYQMGRMYLMIENRVSLCLIGLLNGKNVLVDWEGSIVLTKKFEVGTSFLFLKDLRCSLVFVSTFD